MYEVDLPDTTAGRDVAVLMERGDVSQSSFAFYVPPDGDSWSTTEEGFPLRTLRQIQLVDVAPVNTPAYLDTEAGLRSLAESRGVDLDVVRRAAADNDLAAIVTPGSAAAAGPDCCRPSACLQCAPPLDYPPVGPSPDCAPGDAGRVGVGAPGASCRRSGGTKRRPRLRHRSPPNSFHKE